jgi:hypothetical protein
MNAQARKVHQFRHDDHASVDSIPLIAPTGFHADGQHPALVRRKLNIAEKLAEGRGFWRGAVAGVLAGLVIGFAGSVAIMNVWVPQIMNVAQQAWVVSSVRESARAERTAPDLPRQP